MMNPPSKTALPSTFTGSTRKSPYCSLPSLRKPVPVSPPASVQSEEVTVVVELMARGLDQNREWEAEQLRSFQETAQNYVVGQSEPRP